MMRQTHFNKQMQNGGREERRE